MNRSILFAALLPLAACGRDLGPTPNRNTGENPDATVFLTQNTPAQDVMEALYVGKVNRDPQGCLRVEGEGGALVIWPYGFRLEARDGNLYVKDADGREVGRIGGDFRMGGGYVPAIGHLALSDTDRARAVTCPSNSYWIVGDTN